MKRHLLVVATVIACTPLWIPYASSIDPAGPQPTSNPLAPFERLIGGQWHVEGSYQEFEWGVGHRSVRSRSYFVIEGRPKLVAEGSWYWHPGEKQIRGVFTAIDMPVVLFDYTTRFEGNKMVNDLRSYAANGSESAYVETWDFIDDARYVWKLLKETPEGLQEVMGDTYSKKK